MFSRCEALMEWFECLYCVLILYRKGEKFRGFPCASGARERSLRDAKCFLPNTRAARFSSESHVATSSGEPVSRATMLSHFGKIAKENRLNVLRRMDRTSSSEPSMRAKTIFIIGVCGVAKRKPSGRSRPKPWQHFNWIACFSFSLFVGLRKHACKK